MNILVLLVFVIINLAIVIFTTASISAVFVVQYSATERIGHLIYGILGLIALFYMWVIHWDGVIRIFVAGFAMFKRTIL